MATAFDDTFHVMAGAAVVAAVLGLLLRRVPAAQRAEQGVEAPTSEEIAPPQYVA